ncbi:MAG: protein phosphatase 2C domain-containing protein [Chloroflexi bacterium]|nr:serine/threonine-protein phosphatase [Candidatus Atribacteria bacterium]MCX6037790.1 protein phosphatase 2C domain-containing protein [Chloroflexota bacterium]
MKSFFDRLRGKKTRPLSAQVNVSTFPLSSEQLEMVSIRSARVEPQQLISGCGQSIGKQREHNEDCLFAFSVTTGGEANSAPLGLFIVADGMGGHQYGEVASSTAVRTMANYLLKRFHTYLINPSEGMEEPLQEMMRAAITEAQRAVTQAAPGSGTTLTAALVLGQQMTIGHVGDSRAYALRMDGRVEVLTRDHSLVKRLEELGQISSEEAAAHPQRNVLYRALGQGEVLEPDIFTTPFPQPGYLLLCSDGLWNVLPDDNLCNLVTSAPNLHGACQNLITAANDAGGPDNISAVLVQLIG